MNKETITHEIKLQPALLVILGVMAFGIVGIAFPHNIFRAIELWLFGL